MLSVTFQVPRHIRRTPTASNNAQKTLPLLSVSVKHDGKRRPRRRASHALRLRTRADDGRGNGRRRSSGAARANDAVGGRVRAGGRGGGGVQGDMRQRGREGDGGVGEGPVPGPPAAEGPGRELAPFRVAGRAEGDPGVQVPVCF